MHHGYITSSNLRAGVNMEKCLLHSVGFGPKRRFATQGMGLVPLCRTSIRPASVCRNLFLRFGRICLPPPHEQSLSRARVKRPNVTEPISVQHVAARFLSHLDLEKTIISLSFCFLTRFAMPPQKTSPPAQKLSLGLVQHGSGVLIPIPQTSRVSRFHDSFEHKHILEQFALRLT